MSRFSMGAVCAVVAIVGLVISGQLGAQEENNSPGLDTSEAASSYHGEEMDAEDRIEAVLNAKLKVPLEFQEQPLSDVMAQIADEYDIPILLDRVALDEIAIDLDTEITLATPQNVSLHSALNLLLRQPGIEDLTYVIEEEVLLITTEEHANATKLVVVYRVDDLDCREIKTDAKKTYYASLPQVIVSCIEYDSWMEHGSGEGEILVMKPGVLIVSQTRKVHRKIEKFLDDLRDVVAEIERE